VAEEKKDKKPEEKKPEAKKPKVKKVKRTVPEANIFITASYNNTLMSLTEPNGNLIAQSSAGGCGFKGSRKATPYAATVTAEKLMAKAAEYGVQKVKIFLKGVGTGREQSVRGIQAAGLELDAIFDITPVPHNGCRKKRHRRI
jgi:small subunit ribosomal protein S11